MRSCWVIGAVSLEEKSRGRFAKPRGGGHGRAAGRTQQHGQLPDARKSLPSELQRKQDRLTP